MIKIIVTTILTLTLMQSCAQVDKKQNSTTSSQSNTKVAYRLFPTHNMWTFIKLNTRNGQMWQVQYNMDSDKRFVTNLSSEILVSSGNELDDRFTLYPTQNIYTFILLDQLDGKTWQVQWSIEPDNRGIIPID